MAEELVINLSLSPSFCISFCFGTGPSNHVFHLTLAADPKPVMATQTEAVAPSPGLLYRYISLTANASAS